jgi:hypothetical protein
MINTSIILNHVGGCPAWHKNEGLAKSRQIALWLFDYCGWSSKTLEAELLICDMVIEWPESDMYFPCDKSQLWILGGCLYMN